MSNDKRRQYCLVDHANKQKELARWTPYEFWVNQVRRRDSRDSATTGKSKAGRS